MGRPTVGIFGLTGCAGGQLVVLDCEDELLQLVELVDLRDFLMASSANDEECRLDVALVEGAVLSRRDEETLRRIRERTHLLVALGTCAAWGGVAALDRRADRDRLPPIYGEMGAVYDSLPTRALHEVVPVDATIVGCPIEKRELLVALAALLRGDLPLPAAWPVCAECRMRETICLLERDPRALCLGALTAAGCAARCPPSTSRAPAAGGRRATPTCRRRSTSSPAAASRASASWAASPLSLPSPWTRAPGEHDEPSAAHRAPRPRRGPRRHHRRARRRRGSTRPDPHAVRRLRGAAPARGAGARPRLGRAAGHRVADLLDLFDGAHGHRGGGDRKRLRHRATPQTLALRELLLLGENVESHALHLFLLAAPDYLGFPSAPAMAAERPAPVQLGLRLKQLGNTIQEVIGGRAIHPVNVVPGGLRLPERAALGALAAALEQGSRDAHAALEIVHALPAQAPCGGATTYAALEPATGYGYRGGAAVASTASAGGTASLCISCRGSSASGRSRTRTPSTRATTVRRSWSAPWPGCRSSPTGWSPPASPRSRR